ncbi:MAG: HNH endonuclease [Bacteroidales bacterium]|nr:HNH endonuclease [Bacteroidales bacterium]
MSKEQNIRERLWQETAGHCIYCGHPVTQEEMKVDHIVPKSLGGGDGFVNKVCACSRCNAAKGNLMMDAYLINCMSEGKENHFKNRVNALVEQCRMSPEKAKRLYPLEEMDLDGDVDDDFLFDPLPPLREEFSPKLTDWQALHTLADILIGALSAITNHYGRQEEKQYYGRY